MGSNDIENAPARPGGGSVGAARAAARLAKQVELGLAEVDLSAPQYRMLAILSEGDAAASALADWLAVSPPSITSLVDGLTARTFVERHPDPSDRRRQTLKLTAQGAAALEAADGAVAARLQMIADRAGPGADDLIDSLNDWLPPLDDHRRSRRPVKEPR
ncbi:MAG: MarR family winged helix-turn-helix transcriptional regulator [Acidimicrobiia bacterium]